MTSTVRERPPRGPTPTPARARRARPRRAEAADGLLVAASTAGAVLALRPLLDPGGWLPTTWGVVALVAVVIALARRGRGPRWAPTALGLATAGLLVLLRYGVEQGAWRLLPDPAAPGRTADVLRTGLSEINLGVIPLPVSRPVEAVVVVGTVLVLLAGDAAVAARAVAWAGLPLLGLWAPGVLLGAPAGGWPLACAAVPYLVLLARRSAAPRPSSTTTAGWSAGLVVGALVVTPMVAALPGWGGLTLPRWGGGGGASVELSDDLDLRQSLEGQSGRVVLRYRVSTPGLPDLESVDSRVTAADVGPLRVFTLEEFDGRRWARSLAGDLVDGPSGALLSDDPRLLGDRPDVTNGRLAQVEVEIDSLAQDRLPVTTAPRTLAADGRWQYDPVRDEVVGPQATTEGFTYTMVAQLPQLTGAQLSAAGTAGLADETTYLAVPGSVSQAVRDTAVSVTADATTPYERAMALQAYFRSSDNFTYDTRIAPATSDDAVADFLVSRRGYCVQFATAMAVLARIEGIPSRIAVGFLPGTATADGSLEVVGRRAHAWPELYFSGAGWVRFEPTPAVQTGAPPAWSDPAAGEASSDRLDDLRPEEAVDGAAATAGATPTAAPGAAGAGQGSPWTSQRVGLAALAGVVALAALAAALLARRRSARRWSEEQAWAQLRRRLARAGVTWSDSATPRAAVEHLADHVRAATGAPLDAEAHAAVVELAGAVEKARYAPPAGPETRARTGGTDPMRALVGTATRGVARSLTRRRRPRRDVPA